MIKILSLDDSEDASTIQVSIDSDYTGAMVYCTNDQGDRVSLIVDAQLLKQLCNRVSKAIKLKAQKTNECGDVTEDTYDQD
jgi:transaldolase